MTVLQKMVKSNHTKIITDATLIKDKFGCLSVDETSQPKDNPYERTAAEDINNEQDEDEVVMTRQELRNKPRKQ